MAMGQAKTVAMQAAIGRRVREIREYRGMTQDELARALQRRGLRWTRSTAAKVERGERAVSLEETLFLADAFGVPVLELVPEDEWLAISPAASIHGSAVRLKLSGWQGENTLASVPVVEWLDTPFIRSLADPKRFRKLQEARLATLGLTPAGEAEAKAAKRLGASPQEVLGAAHELWGRSLSEERDARVGTAAPPGSSRSVQAVRGHVTRQLVTELGRFFDHLDGLGVGVDSSRNDSSSVGPRPPRQRQRVEEVKP